MPFWRRRKKSSVFFAAPDIEGVKKSRRPRKTNWRLWLIMAGVFFVLVGLGYLFFWSPVFKISAIGVQGAVFTPEEEVKNAANNFCREKTLKIIPRDSLAFFPAGELKEKLLSRFPAVAKAEIGKKFFHKLDIVLVEREAAAIWCRVWADEKNFSATSTKETSLPEADECFFVDEQGIIFREAPNMSGTLQTVFYYSGGQAFGLGQAGVNVEILKSAVELKKEARNFDVEITGFLLFGKNEKELTALTSEGWRIFFNPDSLPVSQVKILAVLLADEIKEKRVGLEYVDLRVANRAYYK